MSLDAYDIRLLAALQENAELTQEELAERTHLSRSQCSRRLQRLRDEGYVEQVVAILSPERLGLAIKAYVMVSLRSHADEHTQAFSALLSQTPNVLECCMVTGDTDYMLMAYAADLKSLNELIEQLLHSPAIATVRSSIVLRDVKRTTALPLPGPA